MPKAYKVGDTTYNFPDDFDDSKVQGILTQQGIIKAPEPPAPESAASRFVSNAAPEANPVGILRGIGDSFLSPLQSIKGYLKQNQDLADKAQAAWKRGDRGQAVKHFGDLMLQVVPGFGAKSDEAGQQIAAGDVAGGLGKMTGATLGQAEMMALPKVMRGTAEAIHATPGVVAEIPGKIAAAARAPGALQMASGAGEVVSGLAAAAHAPIVGLPLAAGGAAQIYRGWRARTAANLAKQAFEEARGRQTAAQDYYSQPAPEAPIEANANTATPVETPPTSAETPQTWVQRIPLDKVIQEPGKIYVPPSGGRAGFFYPRELVPEIVDRYTREPGNVPPEFQLEPDGRYSIHDGQHRVAAAKARGETHIDANVLPPGDIPAPAAAAAAEVPIAATPEPVAQPEAAAAPITPPTLTTADFVNLSEWQQRAYLKSGGKLPEGLGPRGVQPAPGVYEPPGTERINGEFSPKAKAFYEARLARERGTAPVVEKPPVVENSTPQTVETVTTPSVDLNGANGIKSEVPINSTPPAGAAASAEQAFEVARSASPEVAERINKFEAYGREQSAKSLSDLLHEHGVTAEKAAEMTPEQWADLKGAAKQVEAERTGQRKTAEMAKQKPPSAETIKAALEQLKKLEAAKQEAAKQEAAPDLSSLLEQSIAEAKARNGGAAAADESAFREARGEAPAQKPAKAAKNASEMSAAEVNKELDKLSAESSKITDEMIEAGRGSERPTDWKDRTDPLTERWRANNDRLMTLRNEVDRRYGPGAPSRLPKGFGARSKGAGK